MRPVVHNLLTSIPVKSLPFFITLLTLLSIKNEVAAQCQTCSGNRILNGSFESGIQSWQSWNGAISRNTLYSQCSSTGHIQFYQTGSTGGFYQEISGIPEGTQLTLGFWAGVYDSTPDAQIGIEFYGTAGLLNKSTVQIDRILGGNPSMNYYSINATVPVGATTVRVLGSTTSGYLKADEFCLVGGCDNITDGGKIGSNQSGCAPFDPNEITSLVAASGGSGILEYSWLESTTSDTFPSSNPSLWVPTPGATAPTYNPGPLSETTWYVRLSRRTGCTEYTGKSNVVKIEVQTPPNVLSNGGFEQNADPGRFSSVTTKLGGTSGSRTFLLSDAVGADSTYLTNWGPASKVFYVKKDNAANNPEGEYFTWLPLKDQRLELNQGVLEAAKLCPGKQYTLCFKAAAWKQELVNFVPQNTMAVQSSVQVGIALATQNSPNAPVTKQISSLPASISWSTLNWQDVCYTFVYDPLNPPTQIFLENKGSVAGATDVGIAIDEVTLTASDCEDCNTKTICFVNPNDPGLYAIAKMTIYPLSNLVKIRTTFSKKFVDNTYGTSAIGWPNGHKFSDLTGSDHLQLALFDALGVKKLEFKLDYITASTAGASGYKNLGVSGGDGGMILGSASSILNTMTAMDYNFNVYNYVLTTNSPATDTAYTPNAAYPNWIYDVWYEVDVSLSAFGTAGFGTAGISGIHASPSKVGTNTVVVVPGNCCDATVSASNSGTVCNGTTSTLSVTSSGTIPLTTYQWTGPSGFTSTAANPVVSKAGVYTVSVTDEEGCIGTASTTVTTTPNCPTPTETICFVNPTNPSLYVIANVTVLPATNSVKIRTTFSKKFVDNTYGTNAIGWPNGHKFSDLTGSDHLQLALTDANGVKRLEFKLDYITASTASPSGYKNLGVSGGDGGMILGSASSILNTMTAMDVNFNTYNYILTTNSPATDTSYKQNTTYPNWIYDVWYECEVSLSAFGSVGFGGVSISGIHASPSKVGTNTITVVPGTCCTTVVTVTNTGSVCDGSTSTLSATSSGVAPILTYSWTGPSGFSSTAANPVVSKAGVYYVTITDANSCKGSSSTTVTPTTGCPPSSEYICFVSPTDPSLYAIAVITTNATTNSVKIRTTFSKKFVDNTYGINAIGWPNGHKFSDLTGSDHLQLALTDALGVKKLEFKLDYITASTAAPSGYKNLGVSGGDGGMILGSSSSILNTITAMDVNFNTYNYILTTNSPATDTTYKPNPTYPNWIYDVWYEVDVSLSAFGTAGFGTVSISGIHASPSKAGTNTITVVPGTCCNAGAVASNNGPKCGGNGVTLSVTTTFTTGSISYLWKGPNGFASTVSNPLVSSSGTYYVTITDINGCTATASTVVPGFYNSPTVNPTSGREVCEGLSANLKSNPSGGTPPYVFAWLGPNNFSSTAQNPTLVVSTTLQNGSYTITVTDAIGCTGTGQVGVKFMPKPDLSASAFSPCEGETIYLFASATVPVGTSISYAWSGPNGFSSNLQNPLINNASAALHNGTYTVTATSGFGCTSVKSVGVTVKVKPLAIISAITPVCVNTSVAFSALDAGPGAVYSWSFGLGASIPSATGAGPHNVAYSICGVRDVGLTVTSNGCTNTAVKSISTLDNILPVISNVPPNVTVECSNVPTPGSPTATDNCDTSVSISYNEIRSNGSCVDSYALTRTWTATDNCGNSTSAQQMITVRDTQKPVLSGVPSNVTVECNNVPSPAFLTATDNCDVSVEVSYFEVRKYGLCMESFNLIRTWIST